MGLGILPCAIACSGKEEANNSHTHHLQEYSSSNSSSLASQPSLPSLPSLASPIPTNTRHRCIATLKGHSYVFSLAITANHLYNGSSDREIRCWTCPGSTIDEDGAGASASSWISITPAGKSSVKSILVSGNNLLYNAHQDHRIHVWKINVGPLAARSQGMSKHWGMGMPDQSSVFLRWLVESQIPKHLMMER